MKENTKKLRTDRQKKPVQTVILTSSRVRPERFNNWPNSMSAMSCGGVKWKLLVHFLDRFTNNNRSANRSLFKEPKLQRWYATTFNIDTKNYISKAVTGTAVNIVDVFNCEFPTIIEVIYSPTNAQVIIDYWLLTILTKCNVSKHG